MKRRYPGSAASQCGKANGNGSPRRNAMIMGANAKALRAVAEALEALERGETPKALPPGCVVDPTPEQIADLRRNEEVYPGPTEEEWAENMDFIAEIYRKNWGVEIRDILQRIHDGEVGPVFAMAAPPLWLQLPISMVSSATETRTYPTTCGEVLAGIRSGKWAKLVSRVCDGYAKAYETAAAEGKPDPAAVARKAVHKQKRNLPAVTFSGAFSERADSAIESHSGLLCVDVDNHDDCAGMRARLANDPFVQAAFISPTGTGLKALVRIAPDAGAHAQSFAAARKHFRDVYGVSIDESCKNPSRLCYVAHDPDAFVRDEFAKLLEPLKPEKVEASKEPEAPPRGGGDESSIPDGLMMLPKDGLVTYSNSAASIFNKISECDPPAMFVRSGSVVTIKETITETGATGLSIEDVSPDALRSEVERHGTLFAWRKGFHGKNVLTNEALMSLDTARMLLACRQRLQLPPLSLIHRCPLLVERDGNPVLLRKGYHRALGGRYVASDGEIVLMPLAAAVDLILELISEFRFAEPADKSRAVAGLIMPALRFGGLLRCHFPALLVEADQSQAGKGTLIEIIQRLYGEAGQLTAKRKGGVGSFDEELSHQLLYGRPFIPIDNIRDSLDSEFFEHCLTCPFGATVSARVPHKRSVSVDPNRHIFQLTSNKFESTQDLANRSCVVRIQKRVGHRWKKFSDGRLLEAHLEADPWPYLSAAYTIVARWVKEGKPQNEDELRGEGRFRESWQIADWFAQKIFGLPAVLDGHEKIQRRVANAGQSWVRSMGNLLKADGLLDTEVSASRLVELAGHAPEDAGVGIPGIKEEAPDDEKMKRVGIIMSQVFKNGSVAEIDAYRIARIEREEERPGHRDTIIRKFYVFSQTSQK